MQRVLVSGISGSGKSTLARRIAARCGLPYVELDALHHGPRWVKRAEFESDVAGFAAKERWVTEDQYVAFLGELLWERADTLLWLDYSRPVVMRRVLRRTLPRALLRRRLWNGNREPMTGWIRDPEHPVRWAWTQHAARRARTAELIARHPHLDVHHFTTPAETQQWFRTAVQLRKP